MYAKNKISFKTIVFVLYLRKHGQDAEKVLHELNSDQKIGEEIGHGILHTSSVSQNQHLISGLFNFFANFTLISMTFYVINASDYEEKAKLGLKQSIYCGKKFNE